MRIGILTYHYAYNYGAVLQAYALKTYLESCGHTVEVLNYNTSQLFRKKRSLKSRFLSFAWNCIRFFIGGRKKNKTFATFRKDFLLVSSKEMKNAEELKTFIKTNKFDAFVVGSDQVWNPVINGRDSNYYLSFAISELKISYAASFGMSSLDKADLASVRENLERFNAISVRESTACDILKSAGVSKEASVVLDPVFLLNKSDWSGIASERLIPEKYVLCYVMPGDSKIEANISSYANKLRDRYGYKVIYLGRKEYYRFKNDGKDMIGASPADFISLIKYADVVLTNSFHGTAFSIIFNKQFLSFKNSGLSGERQLSSRIYDLLYSLNLLSRIIDAEDNDIPDLEIDYASVLTSLNERLLFSKKFLSDSI